MIEYEITQCPIYDYLGKNKFFQNFIRVGRALQKDHLFLPDPNIKESHFELEVVDEDLVLSNLKAEVLVNGKRTTKVKVLSPGDKILVGHSEITIQSFELSRLVTKDQILSEKVDELLKDDSPWLKVLQALEQADEK